MQTLDNKVTTNHNDIVKIATLVSSLYEYTHLSFKNINEKVKTIECQIKADSLEIPYAMQLEKIMNKLYVDLVGSIVLSFNYHSTPWLLPTHTIKVLIKQNNKV